MPSPIFPQLEGLDSLARRDGVDTRPTLVRVLTDLYVLRSPHTAEEERHYTELVLRLIGRVDVETRVAIARKLATYAGAPPAVIRRLARDVIDVAQPILQSSRTLSDTDLLDATKDLGPEHAAAIAARAQTPYVADDHDSGLRLHTPHAEPSQTQIVRTPRSDERELGRTFLAADGAARRLLLTNLGGTPGKPPSRPLPSPGDIVRRLEAAALARNPLEFAALLEQALDVSADHAQIIVRDRSGEPLLVAAKALDMPSDVLLRVLLLLNPVIGESVHRVFDLAALYERLAREAALRVVDSLRGGVPNPQRRAGHQPLHWDDEANRGRRGSAISVRRLSGTNADQPPELRETPTDKRQRTT